MRTLIQDLKYGLRMLGKNPGFTAVAVLTLALAIGATTAMFLVINAIFLQPWPFAHSERTYVVKRVGNRFGGATISMPVFLAWTRQRALFEHLALLQWMGGSNLTAGDQPIRVTASGVTTEFFPMLGTQLALGRNFLPDEGRPGGPAVAILSDRLWRTRFGGERNVLGRTVTVDGTPHIVIGVLPRGFRLPLWSAADSDLWLPVQVPAFSNNPANLGMLCLGVLNSGATPAEVEAALTPPLLDLQRQFPDMFMTNERARLQPIRDFVTGGAGQAPLLLFGAVGLVLLIACVNVANLAIARSTGRQREIAIRIAIGASRGRILRQLLTESVLLAAAGGLLGLFACHVGLDAIVSLVPANIPRIGEYRVDTSVLAFALLLTVVSGVFFGLVPAIAASRVDVNAGLKDSSAQGGSSRIGRLRQALASSEVAISLVLLIGTALTLETLALLLRINPGFDPSNVLTFHVELPEKKYDKSKRSEFFDEALARLAPLSGIEEAAVIDTRPLREGSDVLFSMEGEAGAGRQGEPPVAYIRTVSPTFFRLLRIPLLRGRVFYPSDTATGAPVVVINRTMANLYWPSKDPLGQQIWIGKGMGSVNAEPAPRQIVGVVGDFHESALAEPPGPMMFVPYAQARDHAAFFLLRTSRDPLASALDVRGAVRGLDPDLPVTDLRTMEDVVSGSLTDWRFHATLLGIFGGFALCLAAVGIYAVISYSTAQRTHEIGIRMALGAARQDVLKLVVGQGLKLTLLGVGIGILGALGLTRFLSSLLYGVKPTDPLTFVAVSLLLAAVAMLASYLPARRATKVDPMVALRYE